MIWYCFFLSVSRLEEKECDNKKEYTKLHERYSELFKTHLDYMEKTKSILGAEKLEQIQQGIGTSRPRIAGSKCKISKKLWVFWPEHICMCMFIILISRFFF